MPTEKDPKQITQGEEIDQKESSSSAQLFDLEVLHSEAMYRKLGAAFFAQAVEKNGIMFAKNPAHFERIVRDVAVAIHYYLEDTH